MESTRKVQGRAIDRTYRALAEDVAAGQARVASRRALVRAGVPRWFLRNEVRQGRWQRCGRQCLVLHNGPLELATLRWAAVLEVGKRTALDGVTALQHAGVTGLRDTTIHVCTPRGSTPVQRLGVRVHETRRYREEDVLTTGIARVRPAVAAVHAALWARSDREAKLLVTMTVQQRIATVTDVHRALLEVKRHKRRVMLGQLLLELAAGVHSLGELDVGAGLRRRGLPEPLRQSVRRRSSGLEYLDCEFPQYELVLEIDGAGHDGAAQKLADLLRDVRLAAEGHTVIRIPLLAWALDQEAVLDTLEQLFRSRGWTTRAA
jgi:hypothetical protein